MSQLSPLFARDRFTWLAYGMLGYYAFLQASLGPLMPFLSAELDLSYTVAGLHFSAFAAGMILTGSLAERFHQRFGRHHAFWTGSGVMGAGAVLLSLSPVAILTVMSALVMGVSGTLLLATIQSSLADRHGDLRAVALTESNISAIAFAGLAPLAIGLFHDVGIGWRGALWFAVAIGGLAAVKYYPEQVPAAPDFDSPTRIPQSLPRDFWLYWAVIVLGVSVEWCMVFWGAVFMESSIGLTRSGAAYSMTAFFGAMVIGRFAGSRLTRRFASSHLLFAAAILTAVGFPLFWLIPWPAVSIAGLAVVGLGVANLYPLTLAAAMGVARGRSDAASARITLGAGLAIFTAPLLLGWLADQISVYNAYGIVGILIVGTIMLITAANLRRTV